MSSIYRWFLHGLEPEAICEKYEEVVLAEIYAAISYALANIAEITEEIEREDHMTSDASQPKAASPTAS